MYLEVGIQLVIYIRDKAFPGLVELPEQSNHAFLTFGYAPEVNATPDPATDPHPPAAHSLKVILLNFQNTCSDILYQSSVASAFVNTGV
jgi:hypothetical protein